MAGVSKYRGVCWDSCRRKWLARIGIKGSVRHVGYFHSEEEAASAYKKAELKYFGEFGRSSLIDPSMRRILRKSEQEDLAMARERCRLVRLKRKFGMPYRLPLQLQSLSPEQIVKQWRSFV